MGFQTLPNIRRQLDSQQTRQVLLTASLAITVVLCGLTYLLSRGPGMPLPLPLPTENIEARQRGLVDPSVRQASVSASETNGVTAAEFATPDSGPPLINDPDDSGIAILPGHDLEQWLTNPYVDSVEDSLNFEESWEVAQSLDSQQHFENAETAPAQPPVDVREPLRLQDPDALRGAEVPSSPAALPDSLLDDGLTPPESHAADEPNVLPPDSQQHSAVEVQDAFGIDAPVTAQPPASQGEVPLVIHDARDLEKTVDIEQSVDNQQPGNLSWPIDHPTSDDSLQVVKLPRPIRVARQQAADEWDEPVMESKLPPDEKLPLDEKLLDGANVGGRQHSAIAQLRPESVQHIATKLREAIGQAERGALFSARQELIESIRTIARTLDREVGGQAHSESLAQAFRALDEADDFSFSGIDYEADIAIENFVAGHATSVLKSVRSPNSIQARDAYYEFARDRFIEAAGNEAIAAAACYCLARLESELRSRSPQRGRNGPRDIPLYEAALRLDPRNAVAANELGISLTRDGQLERAIEWFRLSVEVEPNAVVLGNLAQVYQRLGDYNAAQLTQRSIQQLHQITPAPGHQSIPLVAIRQFNGSRNQQLIPPSRQPAATHRSVGYYPRVHARGNQASPPTTSSRRRLR